MNPTGGPPLEIDCPLRYNHRVRNQTTQGGHQLNDMPKIYSSAEAAKYLGIARRTLRYYLYDIDPPPLKPDRVIGRELVFSQSTLDRFNAWRRPQGLTISEAAKYLGMSEAWIRKQIHVTKRLKPDGRHGRTYIFKKGTLDALRQNAQPQK